MGRYTRSGNPHPVTRHRGAWNRFRAAWMKLHPACARCGRASGQMHLDHIKPLHEIAPWNRITRRELLDPENVQTLCRPCHESKTAQEQTVRPRPKFCRCFHAYSREGRPVCGQDACLADFGAASDQGVDESA